MTQPLVLQGNWTPLYNHTLYNGVVYNSWFPAKPSQFVGWPDFYQGLLDYIAGANIVGPGSVFFAIDPDSVVNWPVGPAPFLVIEPGTKRDAGTSVGGGRFVKTYNVEITIHVVVQGGYDVAWQASGMVVNPSLTFGPFALEHLVSEKMEQADFPTRMGNYAEVEFAVHKETPGLRRFGKTNQYASLPMRFEMTVLLSMPNTAWITGLIPDRSDVLNSLLG
jgi:hypothetical protein